MNTDKYTNRSSPSNTDNITGEQQARLVMEAVSTLHARGFGLLKLVCYVKEGLGQWRHWIIASGEFPSNIWHWPGQNAFGSIPVKPLFFGNTPNEVAQSMLELAPEVLNAARGEDEVYVNWYRGMLLTYPGQVLIMESAREAEILGHGRIPLPSLKEWVWVPPVLRPDEIEQRENAIRQQMMQRAREQRAKRRRGRA